ncbi:hypothetical protein LSAT2_027739 [Lamellibrachia satsuma]|nr:hypothetical protein LSAT2_027739 [Lamellibrachia satsuma]
MQHTKLFQFSEPFYTIPDDKGPLIRDTNWQGWWKCYSGDSSQYHFKFAVPVLYWPGFLIPVQYAPSRNSVGTSSLAIPASRRACMVQIRIETLFPGETRVIGTSRYGNAEGDSFGTYVTGVNPTTYYWMPYARYENAARVQVKCPGDVTDAISVAYRCRHRSRVENHTPKSDVQIQSPCTRCRFNNVANKYCCDGDRAYNVTDMSGLQSLRDAHNATREAVSLVVGTGICHEATGTYQSAYRKVLRQCLRSWSTLGPFGLAPERRCREAGGTVVHMKGHLNTVIHMILSVGAEV